MGGAQAIPTTMKMVVIMDALVLFIEKLFNLFGFAYFDSLINKWRMLSEAKKIKDMEQGVISRLNTQFVLACKIIYGKVPYDTPASNRKQLDLVDFFTYAEKAKPRLNADLRSAIKALESTAAEFFDAYNRLDLELRGNDIRIDPFYYLRVLDASMKIWYQLSRITGDEFQYTPPQSFNSANDYIISLRSYFNVNPNFKQNAGVE